MAGLYIHIPFCRSRCVYCGFYSTTGLDLRQRYVNALCHEMELLHQNDVSLSTIYLGGGTPSQLIIPQLRQIFEALYIYNKVEKNAEITIECNPDDITEEYAEGLRSLPINRISMGAQTFNDKRLRFLKRRHTAQQVINAVNILRKTGFENISIDLMYGFPSETLSEWEADITQVLSLNVEHISSYCLMIEEGTPLYRMMDKDNSLDSDQPESMNSLPELSEELELAMYETLIDKLKAAGYEHYEISNFAKPGFRSRHNSSYWKGIPYIGIGAAAHSYDIRTRSWNVANIHQYIEGIERDQRIFDSELLDKDTRYNDTITVALRTCEGLDLSTLSERHRSYCLQNAQRYINDGLLELVSSKTTGLSSPTLRLTRKGLFVSDMIMSELIYV